MKNLRLKLKPINRPALYELLFIIVSIYVLLYAYYFLTWWAFTPNLRSGLFYDYLNSGYIHLEIIVQGTLFGLLFGLINYMVNKSKITRKSFGAIILIKSFLYLFAMLISGSIVVGIFLISRIIPADIMLRMIHEDISFSYMITFIVYFSMIVILINITLQINRKFGYGVLFSMITGKYHKPREERRIFMFLDMKDSTGNAERLGHYDYSRLIQSCIHDLTDLIIRYKAHVYQYVGDEVVLTWKTNKGVKDSNCLNLYYAFEQRLKDRQEYYEKHFNIIPEFKAGLDEGKIIVTEVGDLKREIAYHGHVLHTAARLEKLCKNLQKNLLITQNLISALPAGDGFDKEFLGDFQLKGKEQKEKVYGIKRIA